MKRILSAILVLFFLFTLFGCQNAPAPAGTQKETYPAENTSEPTTEATGHNISSQLPMYTVSLPRTTETTQAEDGKVIFQYIYQNISLILPEAEVADKITIDYLNHLDTISAHTQTAIEDAKQAYITDNNINPHFLQNTYSPFRLDGSVLSLYGDTVSYNGGAHPVYFGQSLNYDIVSGERLLLTDILQNGVTVSELLDKIEYAFSLVRAQLTLFREYEDLLPYFIPTDLSECTNWYFSRPGLSFFFSPGELGPVSSGTISVTIPYRELTKILKDAYFPAEEMHNSGNISAQLFDTEKLSQFERFSELIVQPGSSKILLTANTPMYHIRISETGAANSNAAPTKFDILYAAHTLSSKDAILLEADFSSGQYVISYENFLGVQMFTIRVEGDKVYLDKF